MATSDGIFTSSYDLQNALLTQSKMLNHLRQYISEEEQRIAKIKTYFHEYEAFQSESMEDAEAFVGNPLHAFRLIKLMTHDWSLLRHLIGYSKEGDDDAEPMATTEAVSFSTKMLALRNYSDFRWPSDEDLSGAAVGLKRLQETYKLKIEDLSSGILNGIRYGPSLTASECFEIGKQFYNLGNHPYSVSWMSEALSKLSNETVKSVWIPDIYEYMAFSAYLQGNLRTALGITKQMLWVAPNHPRAQRNLEYYENALFDKGAEENQKGEDGLGDVFDPDNSMSVVREGSDDDIPLWSNSGAQNYSSLCRGQLSLTESQKSCLKCRYIYGLKFGFLSLAPFKEETVHLNPDIFVYHDVISHEQIRVVKSLATPTFQRATVQNYLTGKLETANYRISKTAWLYRGINHVIDSIYRKVGLITALNMDSSEELQVSNYGVGGHYEPHYDFSRREEPDAFESLGIGNRMATFMFYLSDVEQGGSTVFLNLGVSLRPQLGSAVFWFNLYQNGEGNLLTRHAACPVLKGNKWVANFWIHERGQEFKRPCSLDSRK